MTKINGLIWELIFITLNVVCSCTKIWMKYAGNLFFGFHTAIEYDYSQYYESGFMHNENLITYHPQAIVI